MSLFSPIGKTRFSFYVGLYFFLIFITTFVLYAYGLGGSNNIGDISLTSDILFSLTLIILICAFSILLFKRVRDVNNMGILLYGLYIIPIIAFYFIGVYMGAMNIFLASTFVLLFNPLFPLILILILSFKRGGIKEDFNLQFITNKIFGGLFFNKKLKDKIIQNRFIIGTYKYLFFALLFGIFATFIIIQDEGYLFKYKGYENYSDKNWLTSDLYDEYSKDNNIIVQYEAYDETHSRWQNDNNPIEYSDYYEEKSKIKNSINIELNTKRNGLTLEAYLISLLYFVSGFIIFKLLPILLYFIKVPLSIVYLYIKKSFSKLEEVEQKLKK